MKRTTKPPMPSPVPLSSEHSGVNSSRSLSPFKLPAVPAPPSSGRGQTQMAEEHRPPEATLPIVATPAIEWEPHPLDALPTRDQGFYPSSHATPAASTSSSVESALREQIWTGLTSSPALPAAPPSQPSAQTYPQHTPRSASASGSGSYPSVSGQREVALPRPTATPAPPAPETIPLGYIVLSAFFLAIAVVGFGVYLAFEVISL